MCFDSVNINICNKTTCDESELKSPPSVLYARLHRSAAERAIAVGANILGLLYFPVDGRENMLMPTTTDRITKTAGVCGGSACIRGSRITVWGLVASRRLGMSDADILRAVQGLTAVDLHSAFEYAAANAEEIDRDIRENEAGEEGFVE